MRRLFGLSLSLLLSISSVTQAAPRTVTALALQGKPELPATFTHYPYANPDAPTGGQLRLSALGTFDSLNQFINKGVPAEGLERLYDSLTSASLDEPFSRYGLLAERMTYDPDQPGWIIYHLRPQARFHDGTPVRARDVVFTFDTLRTQGAPAYQTYFAGIERVEALDPLTVRFRFRDPNNRELPLVVGDLPILPAHHWARRDFQETTLTPPLGSGPYRIARVQPGKSIRYERDPNYWGRDLPVNRGLHRIQTVTVMYYRDGTVAFEAFKAGQYDVRFENKAKTWATEYNFPALRSGQIRRWEQRHANPAGMQGFVMNTRRAPLNDRRVRHALAMAFDFQWSNQALFYDAYVRTVSFFDNSELAATATPSARERRFARELGLTSLIAEPPATPPVGSTDGHHRAALIEAQRLLNEAGLSWRDGQRVDAAGQPVVLEMLLVQPEFERIVQPFRRNLARLGIQLNIRLMDAAQYVQRLREHDFDLTVTGFPASRSPGNELWHYWGSAGADTPGSGNLAGLKHPTVDRLISRITQARSRDDTVAYVRLLDRLLRSEWLLVPHYHTPVYRIAAQRHVRQPERAPRYSEGIDTWWIEEAP